MKKMNSLDIFIEQSPQGLSEAYNQLMTIQAIQFIAELVADFRESIEKLYVNRKKIAYELSNSPTETLSHMDYNLRNTEWVVDPPPAKLRRRNLDLGDVSPVDEQHFVLALNSDVDGIQVDFDDGHCPTWKNQIKAHYHVFRAVRDDLSGAPPIKDCPALMFRPRAWNMTEYHMMVNGLPVPGAIFDFALHMFHNGRLLHENGVGPYFYLPKLETSDESQLWNNIFIKTQEKLDMKIGTIKACVLIENIIAASQMEEILYSLRRHSIGLNCGIWDYCASIIAKFGRHPHFLLPDRNKYVNIDKHFLRKYMELTITVCRKRGTIATSGMSTLLMKSDNGVLNKVIDSKRKEIEMGFDGFMIYDAKLVPYMRALWSNYPSRISSVSKVNITIDDLLLMPSGGVTIEGLKHNIKVTVLFISNWLNGLGHFELDGAIEDSATAEISRWQIWQWLRHEVYIERSSEKVDFQLIQRLCKELSNNYHHIKFSVSIFYELITLIDPPEFITTFLSNCHLFRDYSPNINSHL